MATENILMYCSKKGGDRQVLHEAIRELSVECASNIKANGADNDLLVRILGDPRFDITSEELDALCDPSTFVGFAPLQTKEYLENEIYPLLEKYSGLGEYEVKISV